MTARAAGRHENTFRERDGAARADRGIHEFRHVVVHDAGAARAWRPALSTISRWWPPARSVRRACRGRCPEHACQAASASAPTGLPLSLQRTRRREFQRGTAEAWHQVCAAPHALPIRSRLYRCCGNERAGTSRSSAVSRVSWFAASRRRGCRDAGVRDGVSGGRACRPRPPRCERVSARAPCARRSRLRQSCPQQQDPVAHPAPSTIVRPMTIPARRPEKETVPAA